MVNKSENLEKKIAKNIKKNHFNKKVFTEEKNLRKKCYPFSFPILGVRNSTRALQSSPFQKPGGIIRACRREQEGVGEGNPCV